jgi:hypothetical protein
MSIQLLLFGSGITCAVYTSTPPRHGADFPEFAKNCRFLDRKRISALNKTMDGRELTGICHQPVVMPSYS